MAKPVTIVGMPLSTSAGTIGSVPPERTSSGRRPIVCSKASWASCTAGASGGTRPGSATRGVVARPRRLPAQPRAAAVRRPPRSPRRPDRARAGSRGWPRPRPAAPSSAAAASPQRPRSRPVRARPSCAGRTPRPPSGRQVSPLPPRAFARPARAPTRRHAPPGSAPRSRRAAAPAGGRPPAARRRGSAAARASRSAPRRRRPECRSRSPVRTVRWKYTSPRVATANSGTPRVDHPAVEDQRRVRPALVGGEELDDRCPPISSSLSHATRTLTGSPPSCAESCAAAFSQHVELALVVDDAARVKPVVPNRLLDVTAPTPTGRAGRAAGRRRGRRQHRWGRSLRGGSSPIISGCPFSPDGLRRATGAAR